MNIVQWHHAMQNAIEVFNAISQLLTEADFAMFGERQNQLWVEFTQEYKRDLREFQWFALCASEEILMQKFITDTAEFALNNQLTIAQAMEQRREVKL